MFAIFSQKWGCLRGSVLRLIMFISRARVGLAAGFRRRRVSNFIAGRRVIDSRPSVMLDGRCSPRGQRCCGASRILHRRRIAVDLFAGVGPSQAWDQGWQTASRLPQTGHDLITRAVDIARPGEMPSVSGAVQS